MTISAFGVDDYRIAKAFGDQEKSKQAKTRQKAGLGVAGGGYLLASRTKDVSPGAADLLTASPKKIGEAEHAARAAKKIKIMNRAGGRSGAALVGAGLALAGEGFISDARHRHVLDSAKKKIGKADGSEHKKDHRTAGAVAGGLGTWVAAPAVGSETKRRLTDRAIRMQSAANHRGGGATPEELKTARRLGRVARGARRAGLAAGAGGLATVVGATGVSAVRGLRRKEPVGKSAFFAKADDDKGKRRASKTALAVGGTTAVAAPATGFGVYARSYKRAFRMQEAVNQRPGIATSAERETARKLGRGARNALRGGVRGGVAGTGLALGGAVGTVKYRKKKQPVGKAFDSERQRHRRAAAYEGVASGGAVVAGAGAGALARKTKQVKLRSQAYSNLAERNRFDAETKLHRMGQEKGTPVTRSNMTAAATKLRRATGQDAAAANAAKAARKLGRGAIGTAVGAGALAASAVGLHRSDRKGSGRSYGY